MNTVHIFALVLACYVGVVLSRHQDWFDHNERFLLTQYHNQLRRTEAYEEGVDFLMETVWDEKLARTAQNYADECDKYERTGPKYQLSIGFANKDEDYTQVYDAWFKNKEKYSFDSEYCRGTPEQCAQYLNIVQQYGQKFGCGRSYCEEVKEIVNSPVKKFYFVCFYDSSTANVASKPDQYFIRPYSKLTTPCQICDDPSYPTLNKGLCSKKKN